MGNAEKREHGVRASAVVGRAVILGSRSEIGRNIAMRLIRDGWHVETWMRLDPMPTIYSAGAWNLCVCAIGQVAPVGEWWKQDEAAWASAVESNVLLPVKLLRRIWPAHMRDASVCFLAGANPNKVMPGYTAYATGKMALLKAVEHMDAETQDAKLFALAPGTVLTKIHDATRAAQWDNPVLAKHDADPPDYHEQMEKIYRCLMWAHEQPKSALGGRNVCVSDPWDSGWLAEWLREFPESYKLRRIE